MSGVHEDYKREHAVEGSSNRSFGIVIGVACLLFCVSPLRRGGEMRMWLLGPAGFFLVAAFLVPKILTPLNRLWLGLGLTLGKITTPIILFIFYYAILTPTALLMRLSGKDPLRMKRGPAGKSYWIERTPPGPASDSLRNQF
jgi:Saxitoxin biosynthesis operon protein SxtJ